MVHHELRGLLLVEAREVHVGADLVNRRAMLAFESTSQIIWESEGEIPGLFSLLNIHRVLYDVILQKVFFEVKTRSSGLSSLLPLDSSFEGETSCRVGPGTQSDAVDLQTFLEHSFYLPRNCLSGQVRLPILRSSQGIKKNYTNTT